jgi:hypothetical protein
VTTKNIEKALETIRDLIVEQSRSNLVNAGKGGGALEKSIEGTPLVKEKNRVSFEILMEEYGTYVDKGVSGIKQKYNTPYSYKDKMPPPSKLDKWTVRRGIAPRDEKGRFMKRKTLQFLIARSIYRNGIKPSLFFTNAYKDVLKDIDKKLEKEFKIDVDDFLKFIIKRNEQD